MPRFSDDDVIDFLVTEAVAQRVVDAKEKAQKEAERAAWRQGASNLPGPGAS